MVFASIANSWEDKPSVEAAPLAFVLLTLDDLPSPPYCQRALPNLQLSDPFNMSEAEQPTGKAKHIANVLTVVVLMGIGAYLIYYLFQS
jgi:hypothetical protein